MNLQPIVAPGSATTSRPASSPTMAAIPQVGGETPLHAHLVSRDDSIALYGFGSEEERELFMLLLGVQGVGPKVALAVLGGGPPQELAGALAAGDTARLQSVPGVGKRTAERILVELREKVGGIEGAADQIRVSRANDPRTVAREGLLGLGFSEQEARELAGSASGESPEEIIQNALRAAKS